MAKVRGSLKSIDVAAYSYWAALYRSFYSRNLYIDVGKRWKGFGLLYQLLVIAILAVPFALTMGYRFNASFNGQFIEPLSKIPTLYVQNGQVTFDKPMPYLIKNKQGQVVVIVDTTGKVNDFNQQYPDLSILINQDKVSTRFPMPQFFGSGPQQTLFSPINTQPLDKNANFVFDGKKILNDSSIKHMKFFAISLIYPLLLVLLFSLFALIFLVLALLGQVFASALFSFSLTFKQSSRLMMVAATPMLFFLIGLMSVDFIFPGVGVFLMALLIAYFSWALHVLKSASKNVAIL